ncbi:hypothetical protein [Mesorhizobium sp. B4-1-4]|uniref:hypothetical protein n=1 Tax=Mesorhizobium sp. B4-1-4 TaxID=2589888 RepID=UPI0021F73130|nr:hypothetical protein [Mesorhizobium sp. B4-1-4]
MGKAVSQDLRLRLVRGIAEGKSRRAVAAQFEVAPSTAVRVQARYAATGSVERRPVRGVLPGLANSARIVRPLSTK